MFNLQVILYISNQQCDLTLPKIIIEKNTIKMTNIFKIPTNLLLLLTIVNNNNK
jgi:hypothetical protein